MNHAITPLSKNNVPNDKIFGNKISGGKNYGKTYQNFALQMPQEIFIAFTDLNNRNARGNRGARGARGGGDSRFYGLRPGFGHCFMLLRFSDEWWVIDPLFGGIVHARIKADGNHMNRQQMIALLQGCGCRIVILPGNRLSSARPKGRRRLSPLSPLSPLSVQTEMLSFGVFSCVTLIKRCLGLRRPWIITPYGLYCFFIRTKEENY